MKNKFRLIKNLLEDRKCRSKDQLFVVEGPHLIEQAIDQIKFAVYCKPYPIIDHLSAKGIECLKITQKQFSEISQVETPQGILAVVKSKPNKLEDLFTQDKALIVICHEIQDPGNLGTIIRTADAAKATGIILSAGTVDVYNPKVVRSSMGSIFNLPIVQVKEVKSAINMLKERNIKVIGTALDTKKSLYDEDLKPACAILIGNEGAGLSSEVLSQCDSKIKIPILGKAESLNAAVSCAIILYEAVRQRILVA